jgi:hypothetical protein
LENPKSINTALFDFVADVNHQALDLELSLIFVSLGDPNCPLDVTIGIVFVGLKLIAINVCGIVAVCNRDIEKCSSVDRTRFESTRKVFKELSSSPIWVSFLIVEAIALLLQFGFRCITIRTPVNIVCY